MYIVKKYANGEEYVVYYPDEIAELLLNEYPDKFSRLSEEEASQYEIENQDNTLDNSTQSETPSVGFYPNPEGEQFVRRRRGRRRRIISDES